MLFWHLADHRGTFHLARLRPDGWPPQPRDQVLAPIGRGGGIGKPQSRWPPGHQIKKGAPGVAAR